MLAASVLQTCRLYIKDLLLLQIQQFNTVFDNYIKMPSSLTLSGHIIGNFSWHPFCFADILWLTENCPQQRQRLLQILYWHTFWVLISSTVEFVTWRKLILHILPMIHVSMNSKSTCSFSRWSFVIARKGINIVSSNRKAFWRYLLQFINAIPSLSCGRITLLSSLGRGIMENVLKSNMHLVLNVNQWGDLSVVVSTITLEHATFSWSK